MAGPEQRCGTAEQFFGAGDVVGGVHGDAGPATRQKALAWHLLRKTLALVDPTPAQAGLGETLLAVGPDGYCSPRHRIPCDSSHEDTQCFSMTCRAISDRL